ncbi:MAG: hypothetical protein QOG10_6384 [Kribbellaceae bacterium]|jgi:hypothetical protein|nr:hypothetical protein [Kribbellaceae bacterium]
MAYLFRRTVLAIVAVLVVALSGVMPAAAGGPTSVMLSAPGVPRVVAAGYLDKAYNDLQQLVQSTDAAGKRETPGNGHESGPVIRAIWLIHDVMVWRLDLIYPEADGGPWIATTTLDQDDKMSDSPIWHRSAEPTKLFTVLDDLRLLGGPRASGGPTGLSPSDGYPPFAEPVGQQPVETVKADPGMLTGWRWAIPGFALGALIAVVAVRLLPRRRPWELVDVD